MFHFSSGLFLYIHMGGSFLWFEKMASCKKQGAVRQCMLSETDEMKV